ncbi:protein far1-related sequence 5-like [Gigaspora margarita]|uniref:Protein far1-related sequence 5-like n=1 Tax=Gigaspora margarita TaxID=4874 RepID=A0A8H4EQF9_GIGMA|nr:protein far1-related sequence 5-like [Gigaspora margarita]
MLYSYLAKFHISIIPARWYKNDIWTNLDLNVKNSLILTAIKPPTDCSFQVTFNFQSLHNFSQFDNYLYNEINHKRILQRNRYGIAFSAAKTAINIALETNKDAELVQILKEFITANQKKHKDDMEETKNDLGIEDNNLIQDASEVIPLQQHLIDQLTNPNVTKIRGAPCKKRIKSITEISKGKKTMNEITNIVQDGHEEIISKQQRKCLLCKNPDHY